MTTSKTPNTSSVVNAVRAITRKMDAAGFPMLSRADRGKSASSGFYVHRIGVGTKIQVVYRCEGEDRYEPEHREIKQAEVARAKAFLEGLGYAFNEIGYIECDGE